MTVADAVKSLAAIEEQDLGDALMILAARYWREDGKSADDIVLLMSITVDDLESEG